MGFYGLRGEIYSRKHLVSGSASLGTWDARSILFSKEDRGRDEAMKSITWEWDTVTEYDIIPLVSVKIKNTSLLSWQQWKGPVCAHFISYIAQPPNCHISVILGMQVWFTHMCFSCHVCVHRCVKAPGLRVNLPLVPLWLTCKSVDLDFLGGKKRVNWKKSSTEGKRPKLYILKRKNQLRCQKCI